MSAAVEISILVALVGALFSALGVSLVFKDYIADLIAFFIMRYVKQIRPGRRVKIMVTPSIKGDVVTIGPIRTTLMEVGDGERLPSVQTGRIVKVPNFFLVNNPVLIYGDTIIDEVVAYVSEPFHDIDATIQSMRESIVAEWHRPVEIGIYQREKELVIHGIFEAKTSGIGDLRSNILKDFLKRTSKAKS